MPCMVVIVGNIVMVSPIFELCSFATTGVLMNNYICTYTLYRYVLHVSFQDVEQFHPFPPLILKLKLEILIICETFHDLWIDLFQCYFDTSLHYAEVYWIRIFVLGILSKHCQRHNGPRYCFYNLIYLSSYKAGKFSRKEN